MRLSPVLVLFTASLHAQDRVNLLQRVAHHYATADSYKVEGTAAAVLPGTSWRVTYHFDAQGMQPSFIRFDDPSSRMKELDHVGGHLTKVRIDPSATDPFPDRVALCPFATYHLLTARLLDARGIGKEVIFVQGQAHKAEVIDATYDDSPGFRPHSATTHRRFWIDPRQLVVLREERVFAGTDWTATVSSFSFNQPVSAETVKGIGELEHQPAEHLDWAGRDLPDLTLRQLSGPPVRLADLRGRPVLLDFWGSRCGPCRLATLHAQELARRYHAAGLVVLTLTQDSVEDARLWAAHNHVELPILLDEQAHASRAFDIEGIPVTVFANREGKVEHYWTGFEPAEDMDQQLGLALLPPSSAVRVPLPRR